MKITDLTCNHCGKSFKFDEREDYTIREVEKGVVIITQNRKPVTLTCEYCGATAVGEKMEYGRETRRTGNIGGAIAVGDGAMAVGAGGIMIKGNVTGSIIVGSNNNTIIRSS